MLKHGNTFDITVDALMVIFGLALIVSAIVYAFINGHLAVVIACIALGIVGLLALLEGGGDLYNRLRSR